MSERKALATVLRRTDYRESDRMLTLFSPEQGRLETLIRGCRKAGAKLMTAAELFVTGEYLFYDRAGRLTVTGFSLHEGFYPLRMDVERLTHACYALNICEAIVLPNKPDEQLFALLQRTLGRLAYHSASPQEGIARFLIDCCVLEGYAPVLDRCAQCGRLIDTKAGAMFSITEGGLCCGTCGAHGRWIDTELIQWLQAPDEADPILIEAALTLLHTYMESRLERRIRSLEQFLKR